MIKTYFKGIQNILIENINHAEKEILIAVTWFTNHELFDSLCQKLNEGRNVSICLINDEINHRSDGLNFQYFISLGGKLYFGKKNELMHHKFCIIDNNILFNGSYNWTYFAENRNRENLVLFTELPNVVNEFKQEFDLTILNCDLVLDVNDYLKNNKPEYTLELSTYLSYDIMHQAKQNINNARYLKSTDLLISALKYNSENKEVKLEQIKLEAIINTVLVPEKTNNDLPKIEINIPLLLNQLEKDIFQNYIREEPNREKAFASSMAIYDYEKDTNFKNINYYNSANPGYILMLFGEYNKAKEFFTRNNNAISCYDFAVLNLLQNDYDNFSFWLNKALLTLGNEDQNCYALYIPKKTKNTIEYIEKKITNLQSIEKISLKNTILQVKEDFNI